jgi:hypothetical protein
MGILCPRRIAIQKRFGERIVKWCNIALMHIKIKLAHRYNKFLFCEKLLYKMKRLNNITTTDIKRTITY